MSRESAARAPWRITGVNGWERQPGWSTGWPS
jgi:hypothetical protein